MYINNEPDYHQFTLLSGRYTIYITSSWSFFFYLLPDFNWITDIAVNMLPLFDFQTLPHPNCFLGEE